MIYKIYLTGLLLLLITSIGFSQGPPGPCENYCSSCYSECHDADGFFECTPECSSCIFLNCDAGVPIDGSIPILLVSAFVLGIVKKKRKREKI